MKVNKKKKKKNLNKLMDKIQTIDHFLKSYII